MRRASGVLSYPLKGVTDGFTCSELQHWASSLKSVRDTWGRTEWSGFGAKAGGETFCQTEVLPEATVAL